MQAERAAALQDRLDTAQKALEASQRVEREAINKQMQEEAYMNHAAAPAHCGSRSN